MYWSPQFCLSGSQLDTSDQSLGVRLYISEHAHRPLVSWCTLIFNQYDVVHLEITPFLMPFRALLQCWEVFAFPSCPEQVAQVLNSVPTTSHVNVIALKLARRGQNNAGFRSWVGCKWQWVIGIT